MATHFRLEKFCLNPHIVDITSDFHLKGLIFICSHHRALHVLRAWGHFWPRFGRGRVKTWTVCLHGRCMSIFLSSDHKNYLPRLYRVFDAETDLMHDGAPASRCFIVAGGCGRCMDERRTAATEEMIIYWNGLAIRTFVMNERWILLKP